MASDLKNEINSFLEKLKLTLSLEKTFITNARSKHATFLGTQIKRIASNKGDTKVVRGKKIPTGNL